MATYEDFCTRYKLDPNSKKARGDYQEYKENLRILENLTKEKSA